MDRIIKMKTKYIYFAHPIKKYHTEEEKVIINLVRKRYPEYKIINPATIKVDVAHQGCEQCMREIMRPIFFKQIAKCKKFLLWNATGSCGVICELHEAWRLGKEIIQVDLTPRLVEVKLQDYHYAHRNL